MAASAKERNSVVFPAEHPFWEAAYRISMPQGAVVIWDQRLPHGAMPNKSGSFRIAQFVKMFVANPINPVRLQCQTATIIEMIKKSGFEQELTELGARVFGISPAQYFLLKQGADNNLIIEKPIVDNVLENGSKLTADLQDSMAEVQEEQKQNTPKKKRNRIQK